MDQEPAKLPNDTQTTTKPQAKDTLHASGVFSGVSGDWANHPHDGGDTEPAAAISPQLGDYEILQQIGEGGMGLVFRARQRSADRIVALKVIRPDRLSAVSETKRKMAVERFRMEAQSAAQLEHDNIVTVYDVGEIDGQHYFSMRYVDGPSLAHMVDKSPLENQPAAKVLRDVAQGVQQAHSRGILHRDLKPQNVLIDAKSNRAMVADFGLAKLTERDSQLTRDGELVGTPQYMAPEQIQDSVHVTVRTDVYALGATLYQSLTGRPPFHAATAVDTMHQVLSREPVALRQLNAAIDRDLETICLKCLQKEPSRRYESAHAVAAELDRYLRGEPIRARPLGPIGIAFRWCRRNPIIASFAALAATCLLVALAVSSVAYMKTSAAQRQSEQSFHDALGAVNRFFTQVSEDTLLHAQGMQPLRHELLGEALEYYQTFLQQRASDPSVRRELAEAYYRVGLITAELKSPEEGLTHYQRAEFIQRKLLEEQPDSVDLLRAHGNTLNAIGVAFAKLGDSVHARAALDQARNVRQRWADHPNADDDSRRVLANTIMNIGLVAKTLGPYERARHCFQEAQAIRAAILERRPESRRVRRDTAMGHYNLANLVYEQGLESESRLAPEDMEFVREQLNEAIDLFDALNREDASDIDSRYQRTICHQLLGEIQTDIQSARQAYEKTRAGLERLSIRNPTVVKYAYELAKVLMSIGQLAFEDKDYQEMAERFGQSAVLLNDLVDANPTTESYRWDLAIAWKHQALALAELGRRQQTLAALRQAVDQLTWLTSSSEVPMYKDELHQCRTLLAIHAGRND